MNENQELYHYGVLGQKWGVRRYQNIDGTLTEAGKDHRAKYIQKEHNRLDKQYARSIKKYQKRIDRAERKGDTKTRDYYLSRKADAEASRDATKKYIENMSWEQIRADEAQDAAGVKRVVKAAAATGLAALAGSGLVAGGAALAKAAGGGLITASMVEQKIGEVINTPAVQYGKEWVDLGLKGYLGVRSYVIGQTINNVMNNIDTNRLNEIGNAAGNAAGNAVNNFTNKVTSGAVNGINNAAYRLSDAGNHASGLISSTGGKIGGTLTGTSSSIGSDINTSVNNLSAAIGSAGGQFVNNSISSFANSIDPQYVNYGMQYLQYASRR